MTTLKPHIFSMNLESTIQSVGFDALSHAIMAEDFQTSERFPAAIVLATLDGRNAGGDDPTPTPMVIALLDDIDDGNKAATVATNRKLSKLEPHERVHKFDELKIQYLADADRFDFGRLVNEKGIFTTYNRT